MQFPGQKLAHGGRIDDVLGVAYVFFCQHLRGTRDLVLGGCYDVSQHGRGLIPEACSVLRWAVDIRMIREIMLVPFPRAASRRLMSFLTFQISICKMLSAWGARYSGAFLGCAQTGRQAVLVRLYVRSFRLRSRKMLVSYAKAGGILPQNSKTGRKRALGKRGATYGLCVTHFDGIRDAEATF